MMIKKTILLIFILGLGIGVFFYRDQIFFRPSTNELSIGLNTEMTDVSPYGLDLNNALRTANIYQGLVAFDKDLRIVSALAVSWGNISQTVWEFRLRQGVSFHDGTLMTAQSVVDAFQTAQNSQHPNVLPYLNTIKSVTVVSPEKIQIETVSPDPLLLSKLTKLYIHRGEKIGTGPYIFKQWIPGHRLELERFEGYWGPKPNFQKVTYQVQVDREGRKSAFDQGEIDLLAAVSPDMATTLPSNYLKKSYGLEVNFLMFNLKDPLFSDKKIRETVQKLIDPAKIEAIGNNFVKSASQFVATGVFGFNQDLPPLEYQADEEPRSVFGVKLERMNFDYPETYQTLSEYLTSQLQKAGFSVSAQPNDPNQHLQRITQNQSQLYLLGWQFEDGDAGGFFDAFAHSQGPFNQGRYQNKAVDQLIEQSRTEMNPSKRLALLQEIGAKLMEDQIGIPLFEPERLYATQPRIDWEPRLDGLILAAEVKR